MALSETKRMKYERVFLENKPLLTANERQSPDKTVLSVDVGGVHGVESLVVKLATDKGTETLSLNPMAAFSLAILLVKGIQQNEWIDIHLQFEGQATQQ